MPLHPQTFDFDAIPAKPNFTARVAAYFQQHQGEWVNAIDLEQVGGRQGWRTRCSECRRAPWNMTIENRVRRVQRQDGSSYAVSEYRFSPVRT